MNKYVGNPLQVRGAEQYTLQDGAGNGMRFLCVRNGRGLEAWISLDRCADLSRVTFRGDNIGYFAPCGYVSPQYYDGVGLGFLKSFTAGFVTTCGLSAVGSPCVDDGEELPLHGTISHKPARLLALDETEHGLTVRAEVLDARLFGRKLRLVREYEFSYTDDRITMTDTVTNLADTTSPYMVLYHCNMGYPLLDEHAIVRVPNNGVTPRNEHSAQLMDTALTMEKPQTGYEECCYYYDVIANDGVAHAGIYNPTIDKGVVLSFDTQQLPCFVEWKMMGNSDYVLGLEPGNCTPDGRDVLREKGTLRFLEPNQSGTTAVEFTFVCNKNAFDGSF